MPFDWWSNLPTIPWNDCPPAREIRAIIAWNTQPCLMPTPDLRSRFLPDGL